VFLSYRYRDDNQALRTQVLDTPDRKLQLAAGGYQYYGSTSALASVRRLGNTAVDLNGDRKAELVTALRDKSTRLAVTTNSPTKNEWYADGDAFEGDHLEWISAAAGDLDSGAGGTHDDEVAVAFEDDNNDIQVLVLDGSSSGQIREAPNKQLGRWYDPDDHEGRGDVSYVAVATGDLDGDGFDNEIAATFRDGNENLQLLVLRRLPDGTMQLLWNRAWTNHERGDVAREAKQWSNRRPIDVTTGDLDGDMRDEVVIGFRAGDSQTEAWNGTLQLLVVKYSGSTAGGGFVMDDRVYVEHSLGGDMSRAATMVSLAGADLDGDGRDEIAVGYNRLYAKGEYESRRWQQHLTSYEYVDINEPGYPFPGCVDDSGQPRACLVQRPGAWKGPNTDVPFAVSEDNVEAHVVIGAGDLDLDGREEIVLARNVHDNGDMQVLAFDADSGVGSPFSQLEIDSGSNRIEDFWLAVGDGDGDSWYGEYTGHCYEKTDAQIQAVIHAPPYWPGVNPNEAEAWAEFGQTSSQGQGVTDALETTIGGSVTQKFIVKEVGPSFTYEWEKAWATETTTRTTQVEGMGFETQTPALFGEEAYFGAVEIVKAKHWCYDYTETHAGVMNVCLPRPSSEMGHTNYPLENWYELGPALYPDSWVPVGANLAEKRAVTFSGGSGSAGLAVDGNRNGNYFEGSVMRTGQATNAWWEVDLGGGQWLDAVLIWPCSAGCALPLSNFYVFVGEQPFKSTDPNALLQDPDVWAHHVQGAAAQPTVVPVNARGRYVRVQLAAPTPGSLELAEVQIYGMPGAVDQWPTSAPVTTTGSLLLAWPNGLQQSVPGELLYTSHSPVSVGVGAGSQQWSIGMGKESERVTEGSSARKGSVGMELIVYGAEVSAGTTQKTSHALSWSKDVDFSGKVGGMLPSFDKEYTYVPYIWLQRGTSSRGVSQAYLVLDYFVSGIGPNATGRAAAGVLPEAGVMAAGGAMAAGGVFPEAANGANAAAAMPQPPVVGSTTHPDEQTWVMTSTAAFNWGPSAGDEGHITAYDWVLNRTPGTVPGGYDRGTLTADTYYGLADGIWYLHVRARGDGGQWSAASHRAIRVDTTAPVVQLRADPPAPTGQNGWYVTPLTVLAAADDGGGAGVMAVEYSLDGANWQPYTGPLAFSSDTPGTTVYARAQDAAGLWSEPRTWNFRLDRTPPDSHVAGGEGPGLQTGGVITDSVGNQELLLTGALGDGLAGSGGMAIRYDGTDWKSAASVEDEEVVRAGAQGPASWSFYGRQEVGAGYHIFYGRAQDAAGNSETPYELGRVLWFPQAPPDLRGSTLAVSPAAVRPGETVTLTLVARNGGRGEAHVAMAATLPPGLTPVTDTLAAEIAYDGATGVVQWPARLLWPGENARSTLLVRAAEGLAAGALPIKAQLYSFWPNTGQLPLEAQQRFRAYEQNVLLTARVAVDASLPAEADVTAPWVNLHVGKLLTTGGMVALGSVAAPDAQRMYIREWTLDPATGTWTSVRDSGWLPYAPSATWAVSPAQGVKYLGLWVADAAGNVSVLDEHSLAFVNRSDAPQVLANGQRVQYRGDLEQGAWVLAVLTTRAGDPDLYIWRPHNGFSPDLYSNESLPPGQWESLGGELVARSGRFLLEVQAVGDSEYQLDLTGEQPALGGMHGRAAKVLPSQPLASGDPLSAGQVGPGPEMAHRVFLPDVEK
jgi:uncharacterized repeat protein (TIGR01451 family)